MMVENTNIGPGQPIPVTTSAISVDELYRQYGEATVQFKLAQGRVMQIEQQIQQLLNTPPATINR